MIVERGCGPARRGKARRVTDDQQVASPGQETQIANERGETQLERYDRNLTEPMSELRVALPGTGWRSGAGRLGRLRGPP